MAQNNFASSIQQTNPQAGNLKTVNEFLGSGAPLSGIPQTQPGAFDIPGAVTLPYPNMPGHQLDIHARANGPVMALKTLFSRGYGTTAR